MGMRTYPLQKEERDEDLGDEVECNAGDDSGHAGGSGVRCQLCG